MSPKEPNELTVEYLITRQFKTSEEFSVYIETEAAKRGISNYEMIIEYCEERNVEPTAAASLINHRLKQLIQVEAENLNLMKKKSGKLPL
jgi:hypothetical protein